MTLKRNTVRTESASSDAESTQPVRHARSGWMLKGLRPFDYFVLAGLLVNFAVIIGIIYFWLTGN